MTSDYDLIQLGAMVDVCCDEGDINQLDLVYEYCSARIAKSSSEDRVVLYFYQANIWAEKFLITKNPNRNNWNWDEPERNEELLLLRKARSEPSYDLVREEFKLKIQTNIGNLLSRFGRAFEAIESWNEVLKVLPNYVMALGNRAVSYEFLAKNLYDSNHTAIYFKYAQWGLMDALAHDAFWDSGYDSRAAAYFGGILRNIPIQNSDEEILSLIEPSKWVENVSEIESQFIEWALENCLYLNPLNDLQIGPLAAKDVFHLPIHYYKESGPPRFVQYYDLLKQEYVCARALYFEALFEESKDHAFKKNLQFEAYDGSIYGLKYDKYKMAFRSAYSIFDKLAVFLNDYLELGKTNQYVSFRNVWYQKDKVTVIKKFTDEKNWALKALFCLSEDLFDEEFNSIAQPDARYLDKLRNAIEHRFLSIHDKDDAFEDNDIQMHIELENFKSKVMRMLKLSRAALLYLSLAVRNEEAFRANQRGGDDGTPKMQGVPQKKVSYKA